MKHSEEIILELKKINQQIDNLNNPLKNYLRQFLSGLFRSLGSLIGTFVIAAIFFYFIRQVDFIKPLTEWIESILSQIRWEQIVPTPKLELNKPEFNL